MGLFGNIGQSKSSSSQNQVSPYASLAASIGKKIEAETDPLRAKFFSTLLQILNQGGSAFGTPIANQATSASMAAGEQQQQSAATDLARNTGGQANPVVSAILAALKQQSAQGTAAIPTQIGETMLGQVPGAISTGQSGVGNMVGEAIGGNMNIRGGSTNTNYGGGFTGFNPGAFANPGGIGQTPQPLFGH